MKNWTLLHARLHTTLRQRKLLQHHQSILVAVSGGQDSLCLIKLLLDLQPKWHWKLAIAHCDHGWSGDGGIAAHVEKIAQNWDIPFYLKTAANLPETEAAARKWRYQALIEIAQAQEFKTILTGHTQSDRAETLLYNLIRGAGADGLGALNWRRFLTSTIELVRPLLNVSRAETLQFCQEFQLPIWEDAANDDLKYARNRIRNQLLPYLKSNFNPQVEVSLAQTAELLQSEVAYLEGTAEELLKQGIDRDQKAVNRLFLRNLPLALQRRVLRQFFHRVFNKDANFEQVEALIKLINAPNRSRTSSLPGGAIAEVQGEWIEIINNR